MILLLKFIYYLNLCKKKVDVEDIKKLLAFIQYDKSFQKMINTRN